MSTSEQAVASGLGQAARRPVQLHLPVVEEADATGEVAEAYQYFRENFGRTAVPRILKCFSSSPAMLRIILQLGSTLVFAEGVLGRRMKDMIATYVSSLNKCSYCLDSHAASLCSQGGDEALIHAVVAGDLSDASISTRENSLLEFARKVTIESHEVADADILNLRASGWNENQIAECSHVAAMFACFNRVANAFGLPSQDLLKQIHETAPSQHESEIHS